MHEVVENNLKLDPFRVLKLEKHILRALVFTKRRCDNRRNIMRSEREL